MAAESETDPGSGFPSDLTLRFEPLGLIGEGGMGTVHRARQRSLDRVVAVKILKSRDPIDRERFRRESRLLSRLQHPGIVPVYEADRMGSTDYIAMELVAGKTLRQRILAGNLDGWQRWIRQCAQALDHSHGEGIIHRDFKPENVFIDGEITRIGDFGLARTLESGSTLTGSGVIIGTPEYLAPEQVSGRPLDAATDQYALATVVYEILTGGQPFQGGSAARIAVMHLTRPPPPPSRRNPALGREIDAVLLRGLSREPADRYPSCKAFVEALAEVVQDPAAAAGWPPRQEPTDPDLKETVPIGPVASPRSGRFRSVLLCTVLFLVVSAGTWSFRNPSATGTSRLPARNPAPSDNAATRTFEDQVQWFTLPRVVSPPMPREYLPRGEVETEVLLLTHEAYRLVNWQLEPGVLDDFQNRFEHVQQAMKAGQGAPESREWATLTNVALTLVKHVVRPILKLQRFELVEVMDQGGSQVGSDWEGMRQRLEEARERIPLMLSNLHQGVLDLDLETTHLLYFRKRVDAELRYLRPLVTATSAAEYRRRKATGQVQWRERVEGALDVLRQARDRPGFHHLNYHEMVRDLLDLTSKCVTEEEALRHRVETLQLTADYLADRPETPFARMERVHVAWGIQAGVRALEQAPTAPERISLLARLEECARILGPRFPIQVPSSTLLDPELFREIFHPAPSGRGISENQAPHLHALVRTILETPIGS